MQAGLGMRLNAQDLQKRINKLEGEIKNKVCLEKIKTNIDPTVLIAQE
jgi:hypothetical protein